MKLLMSLAIFVALQIVSAPLVLAGNNDVVYKRGYVDGRFGQLHYHVARPASGTPGLTPIVFFHQNPKSAVEYEFLLKDLGRDRVAIAIDTPGYGESDRPPGPPSMADLSGAMADALDALGYGKRGRLGQVDVFGFHTGVHIAAELALQRPDLVRRVVLSGIAFMAPEEHKRRLDELPEGYSYPEDGTRVMNRWYRIVIQREEGVSLERAVKIFVEDIHAGGYWWYAYNAVWTYPIEERFPQLTQPVLILEPHDMLLEETRNAHKVLLPNASYVELPEVKQESRVFETGSPAFARELRRWLDVPAPLRTKS